MERRRIQKLKYTPKGRAYVTRYGRRHYLDEFMRNPFTDGMYTKALCNVGGLVLIAADPRHETFVLTTQSI